eukprot:2053412-Alexandrium_andersonii.AAC.1
MDEDPDSFVRDDDANLPETVEHPGQAPADAIPIPADNSQEEIDRYLVAVATKVNLPGMNLWKTDAIPTRG